MEYCCCPCSCSDCGKIHPFSECEYVREDGICKNCCSGFSFVDDDYYVDPYKQKIIYCSEECYRIYRGLCITCDRPEQEGDKRINDGEYNCERCYEDEQYNKSIGCVYKK